MAFEAAARTSVAARAISSPTNTKLAAESITMRWKHPPERWTGRTHCGSPSTALLKTGLTAMERSSSRRRRISSKPCVRGVVTRASCQHRLGRFGRTLSRAGGMNALGVLIVVLTKVTISHSRRGEPPGVTSSRAGREAQSLGSGCSWPVAQSGRRRPSRSVPTRTGLARRLIRWPPAGGGQTRGVPVADTRPGDAAQDSRHSVDAGDATGGVPRDPCRCIQVQRPADVGISITTLDDPWQ